MTMIFPETKGVCNEGGAADTLYGANSVKVKEKPAVLCYSNTALKSWISVKHPGESGKDKRPRRSRDGGSSSLRPCSSDQVPADLHPHA